MSRVKVRLRVKTRGHKPNDVVEVDGDVAARLIADGAALAVKDPAKKKAEPKSNKG